MDIIRAGTCIYVSERATKAHLWIVVSNPIGSPPKVLTVMVTSLKSYSDKTVILNAGDHPFVAHDSCVDFRTAKHWKVSEIIAMMGEKRCQLREDLHPDILTRVQNGVKASAFTPNCIAEEFNA